MSDQDQRSFAFGRRLSDKLMVVFYNACDLHELDIAEQILKILEAHIEHHPTKPDKERRQNVQTLVHAHRKLWDLKNTTIFEKTTAPIDGVFHS